MRSPEHGGATLRVRREVDAGAPRLESLNLQAGPSRAGGGGGGGQGEPGQPPLCTPLLLLRPLQSSSSETHTCSSDPWERVSYEEGRVRRPGTENTPPAPRPQPSSLALKGQLSDTHLTQLLQKRVPGCSCMRVRWMSPAPQHPGPHSCHAAVPQAAAWQGGLTEAALHSSKNSPKSWVQGALTRPHGSPSCPGAEPGRPRLLSPCAPATVTGQGGPQVLHSQPLLRRKHPSSCIFQGREPGRPRGLSAVFTGGDKEPQQGGQCLRSPRGSSSGKAAAVRTERQVPAGERDGVSAQPHLALALPLTGRCKSEEGCPVWQPHPRPWRPSAFLQSPTTGLPC